MLADDRGPLGRMLYEGRHKAGLSAEKCAERAGVSVSFLHYIEKGQRAPELSRMVSIAQAYEIDVRQAAWTWILQYAPNVMPFIVTYGTVEDQPFLQDHYRQKYLAEQAEKAARAAEQKDRVQAVLDRPMPVVEPFENQGYTMVGPRSPQRDAQGTLAPWESPDSDIGTGRRK